MASEYCYRHGEAWLSSRVSGEPTNFEYLLPEIDSLNLSFANEKIMHRSKRTSIASKDVSAVYFVDGTGEMTLSDSNLNILKLAMYGNKAAIAGGSVSATVFEKALAVVGDILPLPLNKTHATSLVLTDSTGSPVTLTLDTHYSIIDAKAGLVKILDLSGLTQPLKAAFTEAAGNEVGILTQRVFELYMRFKGINILNNDKVEVFDLYKVQFDPTSTYNLMGDGSEVNKVTLAFDLLKDETVATDATFGPYGRMRQE